MHVNSLSFRHVNVEWAVRNRPTHDFKSNWIVYPLVSILIFIHWAFILRGRLKDKVEYHSNEMSLHQSFHLLLKSHDLGATATQLDRLWSLCHEICRDAH